MSEAQRWTVKNTLPNSDGGAPFIRPEVVLSADFDRVTAERDALQRELEQQKRYVEINADSAHGKHMEGLRYRDERDALQLRLTATDERNDFAIDLLRRARAVIEGGGWADLERDIAKFFKP